MRGPPHPVQGGILYLVLFGMSITLLVTTMECLTIHTHARVILVVHMRHMFQSDTQILCQAILNTEPSDSQNP